MIEALPRIKEPPIVTLAEEVAAEPKRVSTVVDQGEREPELVCQ